ARAVKATFASHRPRRPSQPRLAANLGSEAQRLGHEDHGDPPWPLETDDERLGQQASLAADRLHSQVFSRQAVVADAAQPLVEIADKLLMAHDEDDTASGVPVGTKLAARAHDDFARFGYRMRAADDVVRRGPEPAHLTVLRCPVELAQRNPDRLVPARLVDLGADAEFAHRL